VTRWGLLLLVSFFALGLGSLEKSKATRGAIWITVVVVVAVSAKSGAL